MSFRELNPRHRKFINAYIKNNFNGKQAYLEVYPESGEEAGETSASRLLAQPEIQEAFNERMEELQIKDLITVESILLRLAKLSTESPRPADKIRATELLGKYLAMFGSDDTKVQINVLDKGDISEIRAKLGQKRGNRAMTAPIDQLNDKASEIKPNTKLAASEPDVLTDGTSVQEDVKQ